MTVEIRLLTSLSSRVEQADMLVKLLIAAALSLVAVLNVCLLVHGIERIPSYEEIEDKFDALDRFTQLTDPGFQDRLWGIASLSLYQQTKTRFMYDILSKIPQEDPTPTVCELGFMAGHSATIFLETMPTSVLFSFDLAEFAWSWPNAYHLMDLYGRRFNYVPGDSGVNIPLLREQAPHVQCDVLLIDGSKEGKHRYKDMLTLKEMASPNAILFLDEVNSRECVSGAVDTADPLCNLGDYSECSLVYNRMSRSGLLEVIDCVDTPVAHDGYCVARFGLGGKEVEEYEVK